MWRSNRSRCGVWLAGLFGAVLFAFAAAVRAEGPGAIEVELLVGKISDERGDIDPRASALHEKLKSQFRYESLSVVTKRRLRLALDEVLSETLPNGRRLRVRALQIDAKGALLAIDVQGAVRGDYRVQPGHLLIFGAGSHEGGTLVISLEAGS